MRRTQGGMTLIGFLITLAVVGFFAYIGMKLVPMYSEYYSVKQALKGLSVEPGIANMAPERIEDLLFRRLDISYADSVKPENVKVDRIDQGWKITVEYELRKPMVANLDVVGKFQAEQELTRGQAPE